MVFGSANLTVSFILTPDRPRCHGNEIWDKMSDNSAPLKENRMLFAPTPYFRARAIRWCHLNFSPVNPCCHGNEFLDKIGYNSAYVRDICKIFAPIGGFSGIGHRIFPRATLVAMATKFGTYGLELGLRKRYIEGLCVRWGAFEISLV